MKPISRCFYPVKCGCQGGTPSSSPPSQPYHSSLMPPKYMNAFTEWPAGSTGENLKGKQKDKPLCPVFFWKITMSHRPQKKDHQIMGRGKGSGKVWTTKLYWGEGRSCTYHAHLTPFCRRLWYCLLCYCCKQRCWFKTTQYLPGATCHHSRLSSELPEGVTPGDKALHQVSLQRPQAAGPLVSEWVTPCPASHRLFLLWPVSQTLWEWPSSWQPVGILVFSFAHQRTPAQVFALFS